MLEIIGGWEPRAIIGWSVCENSVYRHSSDVRPFALREHAVRYEGLYRRPHEYRGEQLWCPISDAPMSTSFANSRFLVPWLGKSQWVLWCDFVDMLFVGDPIGLLDIAEDRFAILVVKRAHQPDEAVKMDGQVQTTYERKNWSSVVLWNLNHPSNERLTLDMVNELPGRDLHRFCWLEDDEIGELPNAWNWLVGVDPQDVTSLSEKPKLLHFTTGIPTMSGHERGQWAEAWRRELSLIDATRSRLPIVR